VRIFLMIAGVAMLASCTPVQPPAGSVPDSANIQSPGRPVYMSPPIFPTKAMEHRISGYVDLTFTLQPDGSVADPKVVDEVPANMGFAEAMLRVFPRWKFSPKIVNGVAVAVPAKYRFTFILQ